MKIVINRCYGGFSLSNEALDRYIELSGGAFNKDDDYSWDIDRTDPFLVRVVEELGPKANGYYAELAIVNIPAGTLYRINNYDGLESIEMRDTSDWLVAT